ncbi:MAG: TolB family protein [Candidatus Promineifilaceae bacterium]
MNDKRPRPIRRLAWLLLIPLLLACQFFTDLIGGDETSPEAVTVEVATIPPEALATPTLLVTDTPLPPPPPTPLVSPSPTGASPRQTAEPTLLPAPLYFIGDTGQIMRLEADGQTVHQITDAPGGIRDFDVSPVDGRLVYVSGNRLIETGPDGGNPIVKVDAGEIVVDPTRAPADQARIVQTVDRPRFSPDGGQIAFGLNGVNLILAGAATEYAVLLPSDPYPDLNDPNYSRSEAPIRFFWPKSWSPDGRRLVVDFAYYPEGGGLAVLNLDDNAWNVVTNADGIECCDWAWTPNPEVAILASDLIAYGVPGLAKVSPVTGGSQTIIHGAPETPGVTGLPPSLQVFKAPYAAADGRILVFVAIGYQDRPLEPQFHMAELPPGAAETRPLRDDASYPVEVLWAADGRGAVVVNAGPSSTFPIIGPLGWLPADGGPAVDLLATGGVLRWGPPVGSKNS